MKDSTIIKRNQKKVQRVIKKINKEIDAHKVWLGRFVLRFFYEEQYIKNKVLCIKYCFELVDKKTKQKNFFMFDAGAMTEILVSSNFEKKLNDTIHQFILETSNIWIEGSNKYKTVDYRKIKID